MINNTVEKIRKHLSAVMDLLKIEKTESNEQTDLRIAKMWVNDFFVNRNDYNIEELDAHMKVFPVESREGEIIMETPFQSICEHHWLCFYGTVKVTYIPQNHIIGLSKIPRVVEYFSKRPQLQERLTNDIGEYLNIVICPYYIRVEINAKHECVMCRGIKSDCDTLTYFERGVRP